MLAQKQKYSCSAKRHHVDIARVTWRGWETLPTRATLLCNADHALCPARSINHVPFAASRLERERVSRVTADGGSISRMAIAFVECTSVGDSDWRRSLWDLFQERCGCLCMLNSIACTATDMASWKCVRSGSAPNLPVDEPAISAPTPTSSMCIELNPTDFRSA